MNSFSKIKLDYLGILITSVILMNSCQNKSIKPGLTAEYAPAISRENFGDSPSGKPVYLYTLKNTSGVVIKITNYGGTITSISVPDKNGMMGDIVLGFDSLQPYLDGCPYFGSIIGRYGNRIDKGKFSLDGKEYEITINNGKNHLHGGKIGFDKVVWESEVIAKDSINVLKLTYYSKDGEEGYPGNLNATVYYSLNNYNELVIEYEAETDRTTIVNLTHHSYFNLAGKGSILNQKLKIAAYNYTPVDTNLIPTGAILNVKGTPFDFTMLHTIGERIDQVPGGYDHNFVITRVGSDIEWCASLEDTISGRKLDVYSTEPGLQFYSGNFLNGSITGKYGQVYNKYAALCLETQHFPDSPNNPDFPSTVLKPGEKYHTKTIYRFSIVNHSEFQQ